MLRGFWTKYPVLSVLTKFGRVAPEDLKDSDADIELGSSNSFVIVLYSVVA